MVHLENPGHAPQDAHAILAKSRELTSDMTRVIRDVRVASSHVELDISVDGAAIGKVIECLGSVGPKIRARRITESETTTDDAIRFGVECFNSERFWEAHESLEGVWLNCPRGTVERDMIQGMILVAAALVHHQKDEGAIALSIFGRASQKLQNAPDECYDIDIGAIRTKVDSMIASGVPEPFMIRPSLAQS